MLKIFAVIGVVLVVGIAVVLILAAMKPDQFRVSRSAAIKAPPEKIFPLINDFKAWTAWSPYENKDPAMKRTYGADQPARARPMPGTATATSGREHADHRRAGAVEGRAGAEHGEADRGPQHGRLHPGAGGRHARP